MTQMTPQEIVSELDKHIIGQDKAIEALSKSIRRTRAGLKDPASRWPSRCATRSCPRTS